MMNATMSSLSKKKKDQETLDLKPNAWLQEGQKIGTKKLSPLRTLQSKPKKKKI